MNACSLIGRQNSYNVVRIKECILLASVNVREWKGIGVCADERYLPVLRLHITCSVYRIC